MRSGKVSRKIWILLRDVLILCLMGNGVTYLMATDLQWSFGIVLTNCAFSIAIGFPAWRGSVAFTNFVEKRVPWLKYPVKRLIYQTFGLVFLAIAVLALAIVAYVLISKEVTFANISDYAIRSVKLIVLFMLVSVVLTNAVLFFVNWRNAVIQQEELKRAHLSLQYQSLKAQMKPHFLFNSLSSLVTLINTDQVKATRFVHTLSDVYRYLLDQDEHELIPLSQEIKFLEDYIFLQQIRFGDNLQVHMDLEPEKKRMVVPLSLQMMVENAIKHNEISAEYPLTITISSSEDHRIVISNRLQRKEVAEESLRTGIENLRKRIAYFTDESLSIEEKGEVFHAAVPTIPPESASP